MCVAAVAVILFMSCISIGVVRGVLTFEQQLKNMNEAIEAWYNKEFNIASNVREAICLSCSAHKQSKEHHWPRQMMRVLQLATGVSSSNAVDNESLIKVASGLRYNDEPTKEEFQDRFEKLLIKKQLVDIAPFNVRKTFDKLVDQLCEPYRVARTNSDQHYAFKSEIDRLIRLKEYENINDDDFIKQVVYTDEPIAGLYTAAMICKLIETTRANDVPSGLSLELILPKDSTTEIGNWPYPASQ